MKSKTIKSDARIKIKGTQIQARATYIATHRANGYKQSKPQASRFNTRLQASRSTPERLGLGSKWRRWLAFFTGQRMSCSAPPPASGHQLWSRRARCASRLCGWRPPHAGAPVAAGWEMEIGH